MKIFTIVGLAFLLIAGCANLFGDDDENSYVPTDRSFSIDLSGTSNVSGTVTGQVEGEPVEITVNKTVKHGLGDTELEQLIGVVFDGKLAFALFMYEELEEKDIITTGHDDNLRRGRFRMLGDQELELNGQTYFFNPGLNSTFTLTGFTEGDTFSGEFEIGMVVYDDQRRRDNMAARVGDLNFQGTIE
ncbi:hypothetical protein [Spirochaeta dissipatitropha]